MLPRLLQEPLPLPPTPPPPPPGTHAANVARAAGAEGDGAPPDLRCAMCDVVCNSAVTFTQHLASAKHLARAARAMMAHIDASAQGPSQGQAQTGRGAAAVHATQQAATAAAASIPASGTRTAAACMPTTSTTSASSSPSALHSASSAGSAPPFVATTPATHGAGAAGRASLLPALPPSPPCMQQLLLPALDDAVCELLLRVKGYQERAQAKNAIKVGAPRGDGGGEGGHELHSRLRGRELHLQNSSFRSMVSMGHNPCAGYILGCMGRWACMHVVGR